MLSDNQIRQLIENDELGITNLNIDEQLNPSGIDLTVGADYKRPATDEVFHADNNNGNIVLKPNTFYLLHTNEKVILPDHIHGSTEEIMRRALEGISVTTGAVDPGYNDYLVLGVENRSEKAKTIRPNDKIVQITFNRLDEPADSSYNGNTHYDKSDLD